MEKDTHIEKNKMDKRNSVRNRNEKYASSSVESYYSSDEVSSVDSRDEEDYYRRRRQIKKSEPTPRDVTIQRAKDNVVIHKRSSSASSLQSQNLKSASQVGSIGLYKRNVGVQMTTKYVVEEQVEPKMVVRAMSTQTENTSSSSSPASSRAPTPPPEEIVVMHEVKASLNENNNVSNVVLQEKESNYQENEKNTKTKKHKRKRNKKPQPVSSSDDSRSSSPVVVVHRSRERRHSLRQRSPSPVSRERKDSLRKRTPSPVIINFRESKIDRNTNSTKIEVGLQSSQVVDKNVTKQNIDKSYSNTVGVNTETQTVVYEAPVYSTEQVTTHNEYDTGQKYTYEEVIPVTTLSHASRHAEYIGYEDGVPITRDDMDLTRARILEEAIKWKRKRILASQKHIRSESSRYREPTVDEMLASLPKEVSV